MLADGEEGACKEHHWEGYYVADDTCGFRVLGYCADEHT